MVTEGILKVLLRIPIAFYGTQILMMKPRDEDRHISEFGGRARLPPIPFLFALSIEIECTATWPGQLGKTSQRVENEGVEIEGLVLLFFGVLFMCSLCFDGFLLLSLCVFPFSFFSCFSVFGGTKFGFLKLSHIAT